MAAAMPGKRRYETIDLTGDDDSTSASLRSRPPPGESIGQSQRDTWLEQNNEEDADDIVISSQDGDSTAMASYQLYGIEAMQSSLWLLS